MNPRTIEVESWADYVTRASNIVPKAIDEQTYIYRGQSDSAWRLQPSLLRHTTETERPRVLKLEGRLLSEFEARVHLVARPEDLLPAEQYHSLPERWAVMQHHGAPTRLLDWTESPFVAAYFAVEGNWGQDGAIYVTAVGLTVPEMPRNDGVQSHPILAKSEIDKAIFAESPRPLLHQWFPRRKSQRLAAQQGLFMYAEDVIADHEELLGQAADNFRAKYSAAMLFDKYIIPARLKREFLVRLRQMNIGAHSLFPGLDGLGRFTAESARIGLYGAA
jgi:hypothetical protein